MTRILITWTCRKKPCLRELHHGLVTGLGTFLKKENNVEVAALHASITTSVRSMGKARGSPKGGPLFFVKKLKNIKGIRVSSSV